MAPSISYSGPTIEQLELDSTQVLIQSFTMILFSEIGDKTFLIAAILAMRHARLLVFAGAFTSLIVMSVLSATIGHVLPALVPKQYTQLLAGVLFAFFGAKMLREALEMRNASEKMANEIREAEAEIKYDEEAASGTAPVDVPFPLDYPLVPAKRKSTPLAESGRNLLSLMFGPLFVQTFILTFLGEWGDRSQIATIALGTSHSIYLVSIGTVAGHAFCTSLAVIGGRYISSKISAKHITLGGAFLFLIFGVVYLYDAYLEMFVLYGAA